MRKSSPSRSMPPPPRSQSPCPRRAWPCGSATPGCFRGFSKRSICRHNGAAASRAATVKANPSTAILSVGLNGTDHSGVLGVLEGADKQGARAFVEDLLSIAGIAPAGGRTPGEIADRFLEQAALKAGSGFSTEKRAVIEQFLSVARRSSPGVRPIAGACPRRETSIFPPFSTVSIQGSG